MDSRTTTRRWTAGLAACWLLFASMPLLRGAAGSDANEYAEYEVKAAMIFNFTRFVEWPSSAFKDDRAPLTIGVLGSDPFGRALDEAVRDKAYGNRPIRVKRIRSMAESEGCHILFVSRSEKGRVPAAIAAVKSSAMLTVSDLEGFSQSGGAIEFTLEGNRIRFEINQANAQSAGLTISSKLLKLASRVRHEGGA